MRVSPISSKVAADLVIKHHYMHRRPPISFAFGLFDATDNLCGAVTFGTPASHHMIVGACASNPEVVIELNRLWVHDRMPRNTETWFLAHAMSMMPPRIVLSYADTAAGHLGFIYRAANFFYGGWTDMERKTPRYDYIAPGKHTRDAFRNGYTEKVRRKPKVKYWTVTGTKRDRRNLIKACAWPMLNWKDYPPPTEHKKLKLAS